MRQRVVLAIALALDPEADHHGRADDRARRGRAARDPAGDARPQGAARLLHPVHHPRPRADVASSPTASASCSTAGWSRSARPPAIIVEPAARLHAAALGRDAAARPRCRHDVGGAMSTAAASSRSTGRPRRSTSPRSLRSAGRSTPFATSRFRLEKRHGALALVGEFGLGQDHLRPRDRRLFTA